MRYTEAPARRAELLRLVGATGYVSSLVAAEQFGVSDMTIRRDLRELAAQGLLRRVPGGASAVVPPPGLPFADRHAEAASEKAAVAFAAVGLLAGAGVVALDAGTAVTALAALMPAGLTVITHSVPALTACTARDDLDVIALGGWYQRRTQSFTGPLTRAALGELAVHVAVLSATAVTPAGAFCANAEDAETKRAMASVADRVVLLLDHGKLRESAPMRILGLDAIDAVVVDSGATDEQLGMLRASCRQVIVAAVSTSAAAEA